MDPNDKSWCWNAYHRRPSGHVHVVDLDGPSSILTSLEAKKKKSPLTLEATE